jgi:gas vesicle protein
VRIQQEIHFGSLTGAVIGAGIGILFAPDKGSKPEKK